MARRVVSSGARAVQTPSRASFFIKTGFFVFGGATIYLAYDFINNYAERNLTNGIVERKRWRESNFWGESELEENLHYSKRKTPELITFSKAPHYSVPELLVHDKYIRQTGFKPEAVPSVLKNNVHDY